MVRKRDSIALLSEAGLRPTAQRESVLATLLATGRSLSHPELADLLPALDRVTVFRSLKTLKASGLLHAVRGIDGIQRYFVNPRGKRGCPGSHPHFLCLVCGEMSCLEDQVLPRVEVPRGSEVQGKQLLVYGTCARCSPPAARRKGKPAAGLENK
jgi:Fe2+ or Zn2+ uptake regulation protein